MRNTVEELEDICLDCCDCVVSPFKVCCDTCGVNRLKQITEEDKKEKIMSISKIIIRPKAEGKILTGHNAEVLIDGKELQGVTKLDFSIGAKSVGKLTIEMLGDINVEGLVDVEKKKPKNYDPEKCGECGRTADRKYIRKGLAHTLEYSCPACSTRWSVNYKEEKDNEN